MTLLELQKFFVGKNVIITHSGQKKSKIRDSNGLCVMIYATPRRLSLFDIELEDGRRFGFNPENVAVNFVEGSLGAKAGGRRKIELD